MLEEGLCSEQAVSSVLASIVPTGAPLGCVVYFK
jgi:hypothetical protein